MGRSTLPDATQDSTMVRMEPVVRCHFLGQIVRPFVAHNAALVIDCLGAKRSLLVHEVEHPKRMALATAVRIAHHYRMGCTCYMDTAIPVPESVVELPAGLPPLGHLEPNCTDASLRQGTRCVPSSPESKCSRRMRGVRLAQ